AEDAGRQPVGGGPHPCRTSAGTPGPDALLSRAAAGTACRRAARTPRRHGSKGRPEAPRRRPGRRKTDARGEGGPGTTRPRGGAMIPDTSVTVVACLTPPGRAAIATLGVAGPAAWDAARALFRPRSGALPEAPRPGQFWLGRCGDDVADEVVLAVKGG